MDTSAFGIGRGTAGAAVGVGPQEVEAGDWEFAVLEVVEAGESEEGGVGLLETAPAL